MGKYIPPEACKNCDVTDKDCCQKYKHANRDGITSDGAFCNFRKWWHEEWHGVRVAAAKEIR